MSGKNINRQEIRETVFDILSDQDWIDFSSTDYVWCKRILALKNKHPDLIEIKTINKDGSVVAKIPLSFLKISPPRTLSMTDEQKEAQRERARAMRKDKQ